MCGIYAICYITNYNLHKFLKKLKLLEYRGYDSCGILYLNNKIINVTKSLGKIEDLKNKVKNEQSSLIIGHTRWATHGVPSIENSHPHISNNKKLYLVHNGIIENFLSIKQILIKNQYTFYSETDTEILVNYIQYIQETHNITLKDSLLRVMKLIKGSYSIILYYSDEPNKVYILKNEAPLILGLSTNGITISSDSLVFNNNNLINNKISKIIDIDDLSLCIIDNLNLFFYDINNNQYVPYESSFTPLNISYNKNNYNHFMLEEIMSQSQTLKACMINKMTDLDNVKNDLIDIKRILICGCGTSLYSGLIGKYIIEELCKVNVCVEQASEYRYRTTNDENTIMIAMSQSGETADTIGAIKKFKKIKNKVICVCNVLNSTIYKLSDIKLILNIGPEIGVASTKAFTAQLSVLYIFALWLAKNTNVNKEKILLLEKSLLKVPNIYETLLPKLKDDIKNIAKKYQFCNNLLFMGRGYNYPIALEGALKMKEISYIHAEGYSSAEMKHGPIALINNLTPVIFIALKDNVYEKTISNLKEIKSRDGRIIGIVNNNNNELDNILDDIIRIPELDYQLYPLLTILPLQLLAYYVALERKCDIDQPKNLAKCVTVE